MRERREDELGAREWRVIVRDETHVGAAQPRLLAAPLVRGRESELQSGVPRYERAELAACVAACAEYSNRDSMHDECILLQHPDVNRHAFPKPAHQTRVLHVLPLGDVAWYRLDDLTEEVGWISGSGMRPFWSSWALSPWGARRS
jgi:hypothetical protein